MHDQGYTPAVDLRAVAMGILWGLGILGLGGLVNAMVTTLGSGLAPGTELLLAMAWQAVGGLVSGFLAARRAQGSGWLHGLLGGAGLVLSVAAIMGVTSALPAMAALLKGAGIMGGAGLLGGIVGVNSGR